MTEGGVSINPPFSVKKVANAFIQELTVMTNEISYNFESFKKLKLDLSNEIQEISEIERCWVALAYLNRQSAMFMKCNSVVKLFPLTMFDEYIEKAENEIRTPANLSSIINELESIIPDGEESNGWEFDFVQNALLSLLSFFNFLMNKKSFLFIDVILGVLINIDSVWSERDDKLDKKKELSREISILYDAIYNVKLITNKNIIVSGLKKID